MKQTKTLPQLIRDASELEALLWENGGELTEEVEQVYNQYLMTTQQQVPEKVQSVIHFRERIKNTAALLKAQSDALIKKSKALEKVASAMDYNLLNAANLCGGTIETDTHKVSIRKSESVQIIDVNQIPAEFVEKKVTLAPRKNDIKNAIKAGQQVPGAYLEQKDNVNIK